jgi:hypothetical protein
MRYIYDLIGFINTLLIYNKASNQTIVFQNVLIPSVGGSYKARFTLDRYRPTERSGRVGKQRGTVTTTKRILHFEANLEFHSTK